MAGMLVSLLLQALASKHFLCWLFFSHALQA
jgi:hypothetical protein